MPANSCYNISGNRKATKSFCSTRSFEGLRGPLQQSQPFYATRAQCRVRNQMNKTHTRHAKTMHNMSNRAHSHTEWIKRNWNMIGVFWCQGDCSLSAIKIGQHFLRTIEVNKEQSRNFLSALSIVSLKKALCLQNLHYHQQSINTDKVDQLTQVREQKKQTLPAPKHTMAEGYMKWCFLLRMLKQTCSKVKEKSRLF